MAVVSLTSLPNLACNPLMAKPDSRFHKHLQQFLIGWGSELTARPAQF
jgi:hypothetical protein